MQRRENRIPICRLDLEGYETIVLMFGCSLAVDAQTPNLVKYHATINDVKYLYGPAAPVAHVKTGEIIETNTLDAFDNALKKPGDKLSAVKGDNPLTGPFYLDGAQPGDKLVIKILDLQVDGNQGVGAFAPGFGALNETSYTPMLHSLA
jgi:amidase